MIGVMAKGHQASAVQEFFQLFKTPWEFWRQGELYDVVVATADDIPTVDTSLLVVYGAGLKKRDVEDGIAEHSRSRGRTLDYHGIQLPIYGEVLTFDGGRGITLCVVANTHEAAGLQGENARTTVMRLGYDLFDEVDLLLSTGQPVQNAHIPSLDIHIMMLREWILSARISLLEIPPVPAGYDFAVCLTHDIDFAGIRHHRFDHTMWGFLFRSTIGAARNLVRGRLSMSRLFQSWGAAVSLPLVYMGWAEDFWEPFGWYLRVEENLPATYFVIPFKRRPGEKIAAPHASRRGAAYKLSDLAPWTTKLLKKGCELGVHGIDAWHSVGKGRDELARVAAVSGEPRIGIRMHWLLRDENTFRTLEEAGFAYDSTVGYNETIGYRSGTSQVFRPPGAQALLELPLHIQDGALFFPDRLDLSESDAWTRCGDLIDHARRVGGVLTVLWHDRSHGPERFWGDFYVRLVQALYALDGWFGTAAQVVGWFSKRREVGFERVEAADGTVRTWLRYDGGEILPPLSVRVHLPSMGGDDGATVGETRLKLVDIPWNGRSAVDLDRLLESPTAEAPVGSQHS